MASSYLLARKHNAHVSMYDFKKYSERPRSSIKILDNANRHELQAPTINGNEGLPSILPHVMEFTSASEQLTYTDDFARLPHFTMTLVGPAQFNYTAMYNAIPPGTPINFEDVMRRFVAKYCVDETRHEQIESVRQATKPDPMDVRFFRKNMLINCNQAASWMPGNAPILDDDAFRRAFIDAMPVSWRNSLITSSIDCNTDSIEKIEQHFVRLEMVANAKQADNTDKQRAENQRHRVHNNNYYRGGRNSNRSGRGGGGRGGGQNGLGVRRYAP